MAVHPKKSSSYNGGKSCNSSLDKHEYDVSSKPGVFMMAWKGFRLVYLLLMSHSTIFQLYMWQHIDVQADLSEDKNARRAATVIK